MLRSFAALAAREWEWLSFLVFFPDKAMMDVIYKDERNLSSER